MAVENQIFSIEWINQYEWVLKSFEKFQNFQSSKKKKLLISVRKTLPSFHKIFKLYIFEFCVFSILDSDDAHFLCCCWTFYFIEMWRETSMLWSFLIHIILYNIKSKINKYIYSNKTTILFQTEALVDHSTIQRIIAKESKNDSFSGIKTNYTKDFLISTSCYRSIYVTGPKWHL